MIFDVVLAEFLPPQKVFSILALSETFFWPFFNPQNSKNVENNLTIHENCPLSTLFSVSLFLFSSILSKWIDSNSSNIWAGRVRTFSMHFAELNWAYYGLNSKVVIQIFKWTFTWLFPIAVTKRSQYFSFTCRFFEKVQVVFSSWRCAIREWDLIYVILCLCDPNLFERFHFCRRLFIFISTISLVWWYPFISVSLWKKLGMKCFTWAQAQYEWCLKLSTFPAWTPTKEKIWTAFNLNGNKLFFISTLKSCATK